MADTDMSIDKETVVSEARTSAGSSFTLNPTRLAETKQTVLAPSLVCELAKVP